MSRIKIPKIAWLLMLSVVIIVPAGNDIYIAAMPEIAKVLHTHHTPWILSVFLAGLGIAQFFYGPLLDRFGRKPVLLVGLTIFVLASALTMLSDSFTWLLIGRFIQAIGACSTVSTMLAVVRDVYDDKAHIAKNTAIVMAVIGISPAIAPLIGSYATEAFNWRAPFVILFGMGVFFWIAVTFNHRETIRQKNTHALKWEKILQSYWALMCHHTIRDYCCISAIAYGVMFSYLALASHYMITQLGVSPTVFGYLIVINAFSIFLVTSFCPKLSLRIGFDKTLLIGAVLIFVGGLSTFISMRYFQPNMWSLTLSTLISFSGFGMIRPTSGAGVMHATPPEIAGSAAAAFSFFSFVGGSLFTVIAGLFCSEPAQFGVFSMLFSLVAIGLSVALVRRQ